MRSGIIVVAMLLMTGLVQAQLSQQEKEKTFHELFELLSRKYVKADVADEISRQLTKNFSGGLYDNISTGEEFAFKVTQDLKDLSNDLHLKLEFSPKKDSVATEDSDRENHETFLKSVLETSGYGIRKKDILQGNIGYLEVTVFGPLERVADTLIAAMDLVADTDALIIDLRECRGSLDPRTIPFLSGYFFEEPVHLSNFYARETNKTIQFWSAVWVPGKKYLNKPVYILTSGRTFSGGEAFAFQMKNLNRAEIIGNTTRGGAHPTEWIRLTDLFAATVPYATTLDPLDGSTWEGVGVTPDIEIKTQLALYEAHLLALHHLEENAEGETKHKLSKIISDLESNKPEFIPVIFRLEGFPDAKKIAVTGSFISWERESLLMRREGNEWVLETEASPGQHTYMFIVDGKWINDPANPKMKKEGEYENSVLIVE